jgi:YD repeat-containing protein
VAVHGQAASRSEFGYDAASRLLVVSNAAAVSATYGYLAHSALVGELTFRRQGAVRLAHGRTYDALNRLTDARALTISGGSFRAGYAYNAVGQRTNMTLADGARWRYQYDVHGQLTLGKKSWSDGVPVAGGQFEYAFDDIGNRKQTKVGGNASGTGLRTASYTPSLLNQYPSFTVPEVFDVLGSAPPGASVTVNGGATYRKGDFWQAQAGGNNATGAVAVAVNVQSVSNTVTLTSNGVVFLPRSSVTNAYDADGNLTTNGQFSFAWDAENRLASFTPLPGTPTNGWLTTTPDGASARRCRTTWRACGNCPSTIATSMTAGTLWPCWTPAARCS